MTLIIEAEQQSFVLLRLGERRFAVTAKEIAELVAPSRVFRFPHRTPEIEGVILRRGRIVPVCDVAEKLIEKKLTSRRFYLIAQRRYATQSEWIAIPVTGECELIHAEMTPPSESDAPHVGGWLAHAGDVIEVLNLAALTPGPDAQHRAGTATATAPADLEPQEAQR
jgi:chemotaxis signal transduction protein